jgi:activator of HSP90 ATPase
MAAKFVNPTQSLPSQSQAHRGRNPSSSANAKRQSQRSVRMGEAWAIAMARGAGAMGAFAGAWPSSAAVREATWQLPAQQLPGTSFSTQRVAAMVARFSKKSATSASFNPLLSINSPLRDREISHFIMRTNHG